MNNKSKIIAAIISIFILIVYIVDEKYGYKYIDANIAYQIYLNGKEIGMIEDKNALYNLINKEQQNIKDEYKVDYVYPPDGLDIVETKTFDDSYMGVNEIYRKIENADDFTVKGYIITIKPKDKDKKNIVINVLDKKVFEEALKTFVLSFITEEQFEEYNDGHRSITEIGKVISNMYFSESITIKEGYISIKKKIYTDADDLSQYLLFGPDAKMDTYVVKTGDSIASISEENMINSQEFLIANPNYKSETAMLAVGSTVNVTLINPVVTLTYNIYEISENETPYTTETVVDETKDPSYKEPTRAGVSGLSLVHDTYEVVNGNTSSEATVLKNEVIREMIKEEITVGRKYGSGNYVWGLPTNYPYMITSPFGWRGGKMHYGLDISGTGFRSPIYAVDEGTVVEVNFRSVDGNYVIIEHANNIYTQYAHMYKQTVRVGQKVKTGDKIGEMGETGLAFGVHLHLGVSIGWPYHGSYQFQNPLKYIKLR